MCKLSEFGYSPDYLTGWPFHSGRLGTDYQTPLSNCAESPRELGFCNQPEEISVIPCTENRVYGCVGRFANPVPCPSPGQTQEYSQGMQMSNCESGYNSAAISLSPRSFKLSHIHALQIGRPLRVSGFSDPRGYRGTTVVGREPYGLEREGFSLIRSQHDNREWCLKGRLGCPLPWGELRG